MNNELKQNDRRIKVEVYLRQKLTAMNNIDYGNNSLVVKEIDRRLEKMGVTDEEILSSLVSIEVLERKAYNPALDREIKKYKTR
jgi:methyl coenzyme M reductase subunit D